VRELDAAGWDPPDADGRAAAREDGDQARRFPDAVRRRIEHRRRGVQPHAALDLIRCQTGPSDGPVSVPPVPTIEGDRRLRVDAEKSVRGLSPRACPEGFQNYGSP